MLLRRLHCKIVIIFFVFFVQENVSIKYQRYTNIQASNGTKSKIEEPHDWPNQYDDIEEFDKNLKHLNRKLKLPVNKYNNIIKSDKDPRSYRGLTLSNDMKVLLISDPKTEESAAALYVSVGSLSDPKDLMGLAHFCEHMLFMGTKKYPKENDYFEFVRNRGGSSNAATAMDYTSFYFDIQPNFLAPALDRFAQFFISPLFAENATNREINAVNSESEKNIPNDYRRLSHLEQHLSNPNHPYNTFTTGNSETLIDIPKKKNINLRNRLIEFYEKWYSSNIMNLVVFGKESLDKLENIVVPLFTKVQNKNVEMPVWKDHPFTDEQFRTKVYVSPIKDSRQLRIVFPSEDFTEYFKSDPMGYVATLLNYQGLGSLSSILKSKSWSGSIMSGGLNDFRGSAFFEIFTDLTEEGLDHVDDIIKLIFQYINMMKKVGPQEWVQLEQRNIHQTKFRFKDMETPYQYVENLAEKLHLYPMKDILQAEYLLNEWRPDLIEEVWKNLVPDKIRIYISAKKYDKIVDQTEYWYGTKYKVVPIPEKDIKDWQEAGLNPDLKMPEKNEFIPTNFDLYPVDNHASEFPVVIEDTPLMRAWFKQDDQFLLPKANLRCVFHSPQIYIDPLNYNMANLFLNMFKDAMTDYTYQAREAGLTIDIFISGDGRFSLSVGGYNDKQYAMLKKLTKQLTNFKMDPKRFIILKEERMRNLRNFEKEQPSATMFYHINYLLSERYWSNTECLAATKRITIENLEAFIPRLFSKMHIECLVHGNVNKEKAIELVRLIPDNFRTTFNTTSLHPSQHFLNREVKLKYGEHYGYEVNNYVHQSSCIGMYFQCGSNTKENNVKLQLIELILDEPAFDILRTKEQLGYTVVSDIRKSNSYQGLRIIIQSNRHPNYLESRIEAFIDTMLTHITKMNKKKFLEFRETLTVNILQKPKNLQILTNKFFNEIFNQQYHFNRPNDEVAYLKTITKEDLLDYFTEMISNKGSKQRTIAVKIIAMAEGGAGRKANKERSSTTILDDVIMFKRVHDLSSLVKPYVKFASNENKL